MTARILQALISLSLCFVGACSSPQDRLDVQADRLGFEKLIVRGRGFDHVVYQSMYGRQSPERIHVYLDGDGSPWKARNRIALDPTPRQPLALDLMGRDPSPAIYLGRPCYNGQTAAPGCDPALWTFRRYGPEVVRSMAAALEQLLSQAPSAELVLIGHSGGGTLAMLLAETIPQTAAVITVAGNLDVARWARHHGYTPLLGSLDPATRDPLPTGIRQIHYVGGKDLVVPPQLTRTLMEARDDSAHLVEYETFGHRCCWADAWTAILDRSEVILTTGGAARTPPAAPRRNDGR